MPLWCLLQACTCTVFEYPGKASLVGDLSGTKRTIQVRERTNPRERTRTVQAHTLPASAQPHARAHIIAKLLRVLLR